MNHTPIERIDEKFVKCDRCGRTRKLFQYTHFEADRWIDQVKIIPRDENGNTRTTERINLAQCRGLCEECAVTVNSERYDRENARGEKCKMCEYVEITQTSKGCPIHDNKKCKHGTEINKDLGCIKCFEESQRGTSLGQSFSPQPVTDWREDEEYKQFTRFLNHGDILWLETFIEKLLQEK